ncbi:hypothetical protein BASA62_006400 [Batrachochytrium salamandrivorans]|nr:hypothetical protein BASA62_006400 [Batrachochytrium salamandrivorans]
MGPFRTHSVNLTILTTILNDDDEVTICDDSGDDYDDDYDEDYDEDSELENIKFEFESPLDEVEYFSRLISFLTERSEDDHFNVPENVKTAGAAVSGDTGDLLFKAGKLIHGHLSDADKNLVEFSQNQQKLYDEITQGLKDAPSE